MRYLFTLFILFSFSHPVWSDTEIHLSWRGTIPKMSSNITSPTVLDVNNIASDLKDKPWLKENEELSVKYSNDFGEVKVIEIKSI